MVNAQTSGNLELPWLSRPCCSTPQINSSYLRTTGLPEAIIVDFINSHAWWLRIYWNSLSFFAVPPGRNSGIKPSFSN